MNINCWKGRAFKALSYGKNCKKAGRNFSGSITIFHRGGGSKKLLRRIDFERKTLGRGLIERIEYDPNRTARIALVRWSKMLSNDSIDRKTSATLESTKVEEKTDFLASNQEAPQKGSKKVACIPTVVAEKNAFSYILASAHLKSGDEVLNIESDCIHGESASRVDSTSIERTNNILGLEQLYQKSGNSLPLWLAPLGSIIHNIELYPGRGGALARAAGTSAQLVQKRYLSKRNSGNSGASAFRALSQCIIRLPSGQQQLLDLRCRATIGVVSNIDHRTQFLRKAGQTRWLGRRPVVRGVAMNPIDHPHGGGEGRTKGGRPSVSPWGKPAKGSRRKVLKNRRRKI